MPDLERYAETLNQHYGRADLLRAILSALRLAGKNPDALAPDDLVAVDEFHIRGRESTIELMAMAQVVSSMHVLDVGGGLGGPARKLASTAGCRVTVLDLTEEFCRAGEDLTRRVGLADHVRFRHGNALDMPFADGTFDLAWTQHSSMNIADKERLYAEIHRVLRPGARLAIHEVVAGSAGPVRFPVPWAREASLSHLRPAHEVRALIERSGFTEVAWTDVSVPSLAWFNERIAAARGAPGPPLLGLHLLLGPDFGRMFGNMIENLAEGRIAVVQGVWDRR